MPSKSSALFAGSTPSWSAGKIVSVVVLAVKRFLLSTGVKLTCAEIGLLWLRTCTGTDMGRRRLMVCEPPASVNASPTMGCACAPFGARFGVTTTVTCMGVCTSLTQRPDSQCWVVQSASTEQVFISAAAWSLPKLQPLTLLRKNAAVSSNVPTCDRARSHVGTLL